MKRIFLSMILLGLTVLNIDAKILEAKQLFNKELVEVQRQTINESKQFYGNTSVNTSNIEDIVVRFDGYITFLNASKDYMFLKKEEPLFSVYSNEVQTIQKELHILKNINQKVAQSAYEKLIALDIDALELKRMKASNKSLDEVTFYAPFNAMVLQRNINKGSFAQKGKLLLQLANIDTLWFVAKVYQQELPFIKKGMQADIKIDGIAQTLSSQVDFVYPYVDEKTKTVDVRFVVENKALTLTPNMFGKVKVTTKSKTALTLPKTAVITKGDKHFVFLSISADEYEPLEVEAKRIGSHMYEIISGINEGEKVINNALFLLDSDAITNSLYSSDNEDW